MAEKEEVQENSSGQEWLQELEILLEEYDRVFLVPDEGGIEISLFSRLFSTGIEKNEGQKVLVLSAIGEMKNLGFAYRKITRETVDDLYHLYHLYEFSDRFQVISRKKNIGGLWNLVDAGLLSWDEMAKALLA